MQMRCVASAGVARITDKISFVDDVTWLQFHTFEMRKAGFKAKVVLNDNAVATQLCK